MNIKITSFVDSFTTNSIFEAFFDIQSVAGREPMSETRIVEESLLSVSLEEFRKSRGSARLFLSLFVEKTSYIRSIDLLKLIQTSVLCQIIRTN